MVTMDQRGIGEGEGSTVLHCTALYWGEGEEKALLYILLYCTSDAVSHCGRVHCTVHCSAVQCIQNKYVHTAGVYIFVLTVLEP